MYLFPTLEANWYFNLAWRLMKRINASMDRTTSFLLNSLPLRNESSCVKLCNNHQHASSMSQWPTTIKWKQHSALPRQTVTYGWPPPLPWKLRWRSRSFVHYPTRFSSPSLRSWWFVPYDADLYHPCVLLPISSWHIPTSHQCHHCGK